MVIKKGSYGAGNMDLASKKCVPCEAGTPPMTKEEAEKYMAEINKTRPVIPAPASLATFVDAGAKRGEKAGIQQSPELWILDPFGSTQGSPRKFTLKGKQVENDKRGKTLRLRKKFKFDTYMAGVDFVNKVAKIAEAEGHHPDIFIGWRRVTINIMTHAIGGLSQNDFIMAAKIDKLL